MTKTSWDIFLDFECKNRLFDYCDSNGIFVWDIVRHYVYLRTEGYRDNESNKEQTVGNKIISKLGTIPLFFKWILSKHKDYLVLLCSRNKVEGRILDQAMHRAIETIGYDQCYMVESWANPFDTRLVYPVKPSPSFQGLLLYVIRNDYDFSKIIDVVNRKYPNVGLTQDLLCLQYRNFYAQYYYYRCFFRLRKFKKVLMVQNGYHKGLFYAAHKRRIPVYEFQHGYVSRAHMAYSYPKNYAKLEDKIYNADKVLSYGDFWFKGVFNPVSKFVPIGNDYQAPIINRDKIEKMSFVVVSANVFGKALQELVLEILKDTRSNAYHFYYKLHPNEFNKFEDICAIFKDYPQVEVISNQKGMPELLKMAESTLLIQSTASYEALYVGVKVFVYKRYSWEMNEDIADKKGVYFVDNAEELICQYEKSKNVEMKPDEQYFMKFDKDAFLNAIS